MLVRLIGVQAATKPVLLTFEDAHWADPSSLELLELAMEQLAALPVLLIISFRSEFVTPWIGRPGVSLIALSRLNARQSALLAMQVAAARMLDTAILERIVTKTDGVPLFIEELTKHLLDAPLQRDPALQPVPETLHASLLARLDSIPAGKQVAQLPLPLAGTFPICCWPWSLGFLGRCCHRNSMNSSPQGWCSGVAKRRTRPIPSSMR